jgi:hypothetical protein
VFFAFLATLGLLAARAIEPGRHDIELDVYVLVLGLLGLLALLSVMGGLAPHERQSAIEAALDPEEPELPRIAELDRIERELYMGAAREFDYHYRLRPIVREIAAARLERRGLSLDSGSPAVRDVLGDELAELTDAEREPPSNRQSPGPGLEHLRRTVDQLERL